MICCHRLWFSLSNDKSSYPTFVSRGSVKAFAINKGVLVPFSNDQQRWHPDKCLASGNAQIVGEAKEKFQEIQKAYSVLSDSNKRFLYDVGVYDNDDDNDENGMGDFIGEMLEMMSQTKPNENSQDNFQELQQLFVEMFQEDLDAGFGGSIFHGGPWAQPTNGQDCWTSSGLHFANGRSKCGNKRGNSAVNLGKVNLEELEHGTSDFYFGLNDAAQPSQGKGGSNNKRRNGKKQKVSSNHDVSS